MTNKSYLHFLRRALVVLVLCMTLMSSGVTSALSASQKKLYQSGVNYFDITAGVSCSAVGSAGASSSDATLSGSDNAQKAFNYFKTKGLNDMTAAAITANLEAESSINPKSNQGGGPGMGIAQWGNPGRWNELETFASSQGKDKFSLALQFDFLWKELGDTYGSVLTKTNQQTTVEDATAFFMGTASAGLYPGNVVDSATQSYINKYGRQPGFENPGSPHLDKRIGFAQTILKQFGSGVVSGSNAPSGCTAAGGVNCTNSSDSGTGGDTTALSAVRQSVVCLTEAEYQKWQSGQMKTGGDFKTYSQGNDQEWCADFASWIYNQAGYPIGDGGNWRVPAVDGITQIGKANTRFTYHSSSDYTPVPGDMAIHSYSHVNIVVSVNQSSHSITLIGGNQGGESNNAQSIVDKYSVPSYNGDSIIGYVSPKQ